MIQYFWRVYMKKEFACIGDGTYILSESENPNIFYFYREDGGLLEDVGDIPMEMHGFYVQHKMFNGEFEKWCRGLFIN